MSSGLPKLDSPAPQSGAGEAEVPPAPEGTVEAPPAGPEQLEEEEAAPALAPLAYDELRGALEALLYASPDPLSVRELKKAFPEAPAEMVVRALQDLAGLYQAPARGLQLIEVAGGYQITSRPEYHDRIGRLLDEKRPSRLSTQALETLAVIAYRQPITVPEIIALRGVRSASVVRTLLERKLIRIMGRKPVVGRPLLYGTTREFLSRFGLKDLGELPRKEDLAEIFGEAVEVAAALDDLPETMSSPQSIKTSAPPPEESARAEPEQEQE